MNKERRDIIRRSIVNLIANIADPDSVNELLYERGVFSRVLKEEVEAQKTVTNKIRKILEYIPKRGNDAFDKFHQVLIDTEHVDAANCLIPPLTDEEFSPGRPNKDLMTMAIKVEKCCQEIYRKYWNDSGTYSMKKQKRGRAVIINNKIFNVTDLNPREGTEMDRDRLKVLFEQLSFDVVVHEEQNVQSIRDVLEKEKNDDYHKKADCFILTILSHGNKDGIYGVDGNVVPVGDITGYFTSISCPNLAGKPKIFFIQACLGEGQDLGGAASAGADDSDALDSIKSMSLNQTDGKKESGETKVATPRDIFVAFATHPDFISLRNTKYGTWFIQAVISVFQTHCHKLDLTSLLTKVNYLVSEGKTHDGVLQAARYESSFIKAFYFFPGCHE